MKVNWAAIIPLANEADELDLLVAELKKTIDKKASADNTLDLCKKLESKDHRFKLVWAPENKNVVGAYIRGYKEALDKGHAIIIEVVTSISEPNDVLKELSRGCLEYGVSFYMMGDKASPKGFYIEGCEFYDLERQYQTNFETANICLTKHYARKNIGYLLTIKNGANVILETDDDNMPLDGFWQERVKKHKALYGENIGWVNVYQFFQTIQYGLEVCLLIGLKKMHL